MNIDLIEGIAKGFIGIGILAFAAHEFKRYHISGYFRLFHKSPPAIRRGMKRNLQARPQHTHIPPITGKEFIRSLKEMGRN